MRGVVLIVIDCLRADHLSCYGYHRATTPTIDTMARRGILWENAYAASSWTKPSVTSIFTGVYPSQHGVFRGIKRSRVRRGDRETDAANITGHSEVTTDVLRSTQGTLAEKFSAAGWRCGAFINNAQIGEFTGLQRGFDTYVSNAGKADRLIGLFTDWLDADPNEPFFGYLHLLEAHWPYKPRRRHMAMFGGDRDTNFFKDHSARDFGRLRRSIRRHEADLSEDQLAQMVQMYDGAVRRLDGKVKLVLSQLRERGLDKEAAVFVTADHGEEFLEHGLIGHGQSLYDELVHVPLVGVIPGMTGKHAASVPGNGQSRLVDRRSGPVSHVDLANLLLGVAGVAEGGIPDAFSASPTEHGPVFGELSAGSRYAQTIRVQDRKLHRTFKFTRENGQPRGTESPHEQIAHTPHRIELELYDLTRDAGEQVNVASENDYAIVRDELVARLDEWWQGVASADMEEIELDPRVVERLRDLGYID